MDGSPLLGLLDLRSPNQLGLRHHLLPAGSTLKLKGDKNQVVADCVTMEDTKVQLESMLECA